MTMTQDTLTSLSLSPAAAQRVQFLREKKGNPALNLRLSVLGGGCSGFQYKFEFAETAEADDVIISQDGVDLLVDPVSLDLLQGAEIDYVQELVGASFQVRNPNASSSCGCGSSFSI